MLLRHARLIWIVVVCVAQVCFGAPAAANGSLFSRDASLIQARSKVTAPTRMRASLFLRAPKTGLHASREPEPSRTHPRLRAGPRQLDRLRALIEAAESRRDGYDAVQHGAKIRPGQRPTRMTLGDIFAWIEATPGQPHAIGRYQFIPATLRRLTKRLGLRRGTRFSPRIQDRMADILLAEAGFGDFQTGRLSREAFMRNLAKIWAGLPTANGRSYYHGYAGNKASMTWAMFDREMARIFPS